MCNSGRSRAWCFTLNNYTEEEQEQVAVMSADTTYMIIGRETGEQGTPHLQGYAYFANAKTLTRMKKYLSRAHFEIAKGSVEKNITYCSKEGDWTEVGERPMDQATKGKRGREYWEEQLSLAKRGKVDQCDPKLQITHDQALARIAAKHAAKPEELDIPDGHNLWYYGPTGTGKSRKARSEHPELYDKSLNKWWCAYSGEKVVLLDDFGKDQHVLGTYLKRWADRYPFPAEIKGGKMTIRPELIIVTSNYHPSEIWTDPNIVGPIERRFSFFHFQGSINDVL